MPKSIKTHYIGPTNTRGSRIQASDCDTSRPNKIIVPYPDGPNEHRQVAEQLAAKMGWTDQDLIEGGLGNDSVFVMLFTKSYIMQLNDEREILALLKFAEHHGEDLKNLAYHCRVRLAELG